MLINKAETALVNSPPRRWLQRYYETRCCCGSAAGAPGGAGAGLRVRIAVALPGADDNGGCIQRSHHRLVSGLKLTPPSVESRISSPVTTTTRSPVPAADAAIACGAAVAPRRCHVSPVLVLTITVPSGVIPATVVGSAQPASTMGGAPGVGVQVRPVSVERSSPVSVVARVTVPSGDAARA